MLRRIPSTSDGKIVDKLLESTRVNLPFRSPSVSKPPSEKPQRKRKKVSYKESQNENDGDEGDDDDAKSKKKRRKSGNGKDGEEYVGDDNITYLASFPVFTPKPFSEIEKKFSIPSITNKKSGQVIRHSASNISLGLKVQPVVIPRPLHDPMADHAIVLYDPTIDDRETDEERAERLKEEARLKALEENAEKVKGLFNPHKSLRAILGEGVKNNGKDKRLKKVPVVIDPVLSKVLRPHQIEGVKVCASQFTRHYAVLNDFV